MGGTHLVGAAVADAPAGEGAVGQRRLVAAALDVVHEDRRGRTEGRLRQRLLGAQFEAQLAAHDVGVVETEEVVAHGAPVAEHLHLDAALVARVAAGQSYLKVQLRLAVGSVRA